jgi:DNA-nicking Smr family endonuclease
MGRGASISCSSMTARHPSREERALWRAAMSGVAPLTESSPAPSVLPAEKSASRAKKPARSATPSELTVDAAPGLDRRSAERLRRGARRNEARLDLHGLTQAEAHRALEAFLARADAAEQRCVLVITGKGGVLRSGVPRWINEQPNRSRVLAFTPAQPRDGGAGALYVLLRRRR